MLSPLCWYPLCFPKTFNNSINFLNALSIMRADIEHNPSFDWDTFAFNFYGKPLLLVSIEEGNECVLQVVLKLTLVCRLSIISCLAMTKVFVSLGRKMDRWSLIIQWFIIFYRVLIGCSEKVTYDVFCGKYVGVKLCMCDNLISKCTMCQLSKSKKQFKKATNPIIYFTNTH